MARNIVFPVSFLVLVLCLGRTMAQVYSYPQDNSNSQDKANSQGKSKNLSQNWGTSIPPRVFITDSESWEMAGGSGGSSSGFGGGFAGGARPQTAEIIKTFGERCPEIRVNNIKDKVDYIVVLDHEGGKGYLRHRNKVAVFARISGDSVFSKSTLSLGGSVQDACEAINSDWIRNGVKLRNAAAAEDAVKNRATQPTTIASSVPSPPSSVPVARISIVSTPDGCDIELDGNFVGNTPSDLQLAEGDHTIAVKKSGFKDWQRTIKVSAGSNVRLNAELEKTTAQ